MMLCPLHGLQDGKRCPICYASNNKEYNKHRRNSDSRSFYNSSRWRRLRGSYIKGNPLCVVCGRIGKVVDHIQEIRDGGAKWETSNFQTLCLSCHNRKTFSK